VSIGDWVFCSPGADEEYLAFAREMGVSERVIEASLRFRELVPSFLSQHADQIAHAAPAIVGFTTAFNQTLASLALANALRERMGDSVRIVFGGANCQGPMGAALHRTYPVIDVVVRGEGEAVLPDLALDLLAGRQVRPRPGLCFRGPDGRSVVVDEAPGTVALDEVPTPRYDDYFERLDAASFRDAVAPDVKLFYESARGCWWGQRSHCAFCGISDLAMPFRAKRPERVVDDLAELAERHGTAEFFFVDYILSRSYFDDVLPRLRDSGVDFRIFCETKANLRRDEVELLRDAGFTSIQAGVESLSTPVLKLMRKGVSALQNLRLLKWCAEYGVRLYWNVLYGIPGEPPEEYARMAGLVPSLVHLEPPRLVPLQLDRFSPYFESPDDFGIVPVGPRRDFGFIYPPDVVDDIAYSFDFRYADGRDPAEYTAGFRCAVREWQSSGRAAIGTLTYDREGDGLVVTDRRPGLDAAEYRFGETESRIYLACEDGATPARAAAAAPDRDAVEVEEFLDELVESRLVCRADGRYLALALRPRAHAGARDVRGLEAVAGQA
jgi:ribosomal peptide maturation radical SAM protein 1